MEKKEIIAVIITKLIFMENERFISPTETLKLCINLQKKKKEG